jgi:hypothetical protein
MPARWVSIHSTKRRRTSCRLRPRSVSAYSTRGGTVGKTARETSPSRSLEVRQREIRKQRRQPPKLTPKRSHQRLAPQTLHIPSDRLRPDGVGECVSTLIAGARQHLGAARPNDPRKLGHHPRLTDPSSPYTTTTGATPSAPAATHAASNAASSPTRPTKSQLMTAAGSRRKLGPAASPLFMCRASIESVRIP